MKFHELLHQYNWDDVHPTLLQRYPDQDTCLEGYQRVFTTLQTLAPVETTLRICIEQVTDDLTGETYADVSGKDGTLKKDHLPEHFKDDDVGNQEEAFAIEFVDWAEWLGMAIDPETLSAYPGSDIIAHCLWEMTFYGFSPEAIKRMADEIMQRGKDGKSLTLDELRRDLDLDVEDEQARE